MKDKKFFIIGGLIVILIVIIVLVFSFGKKTTQPPTTKEVELVWWNFGEEKSLYEPLINAYQKKNPKVKIRYIKKNYKSLEEYQNETVNALADGTGPDIWTIPKDWVLKHYKKLSPLPKNIGNSEKLTNQFFPVVKKKILINNQVYGIPFDIDTLVLICNLKHFNQEDIEREIPTWDIFVKDVEKLTKREDNAIRRAGTALGTSYNVNHSFDILSLLMLQNGTKMISENKKEAYFNRSEEKEGKVYYPGTEALKFYASFAWPNKKSYTWNNSMKNSLEEFIAGNVSILIGYLSDVKTIKRRAPKLEIEILPLPQTEIGAEINYSNFKCHTVTKNCTSPEIAWDFLVSCLNPETLNEYYATNTNNGENKISALKEIAQSQKSLLTHGDQIIKQMETAQDWDKVDYFKIEQIFMKMINAVNSGQAPQAAIDAAAKDVNYLLSGG